MLESLYSGNKTEAGCDEAGRGCLAGPVFAFTVIFPRDYKNPHLNDSKKLSSKQGIKLRKKIEADALSWSVAMVDNSEIDRINILQASILAMHNALDNLAVRPDFIVVDGNRFTPYGNIPHQCIVKGDGKVMSIAAASILAKTYRDNYMQELSKKHPRYGWDRNKGYPTLEHRKQIKTLGPTPFHRHTFKH
jgi:ribonuclease HII